MSSYERERVDVGTIPALYYFCGFTKGLLDFRLANCYNTLEGIYGHAAIGELHTSQAIDANY